MTTLEAYAVTKQTLLVLLPELLVLAVATAMMTAGAFVRLPRRSWAAASASTLVLATLALILLRREGTDPYAAVALNDALSGYARLGLLLAGLVIVALAHDQVDDARAAEFFGAILMVHAGAMLVAAANELVFLFVGLELVSIPTYLLLYLPRRDAETQEAATKYFYLSIFSSALLLFGLAYVYGLTGISNLKALGYVLHAAGSTQAVPQAQWALIALVFVTAGLGFRLAAVPFHFYAPDVYQGSPTIIAALLAWIPKAVGALAMLRVLAVPFGWARPESGLIAPNLELVSHRAVWLAAVVAIATMTLGNTVALTQNNLKRLFAYSSIAHAGYLMVGITAAFRNGPNEAGAYLGGSGVVFYLGAYALMTLGAFGIIIALSTPKRPVETVGDLAGLGRTHPAAAWAMALCLFSLAGVPPLAGFWGKFQIFGSALAASRGPETKLFQTLAVLGVLNAAVGAYYYLRIVVAMVFGAADEPLQPRPTWPKAVAVGACATLSLALGLFPAPLGRASSESGAALVAQPGPAPAPTTDPAPIPASTTASTR